VWKLQSLFFERENKVTFLYSWELLCKQLHSDPENIGLHWILYKVRQEKVIYFQITLFKITIFWCVKRCIMANRNHFFQELSTSIFRVENTISSYETLVLIYRTARRLIPDDRLLNLHCGHNIKSSYNNYLLIDKTDFLKQRAEECFSKMCRSTNDKDIFPIFPRPQNRHEMKWG
jgi:hypothetical protein